MILKASTTSSIGHAGRLGTHLLNERDNEEVQVLEIRGHATDDAKQAILFMHGAVALTKGRNGCFQVSINPEPGEAMTEEQWQDAINRIEREFKYDGQPRVIVQHVKEGRKHRHIVWQRTDYETEKVIPIDDYKDRLVNQAREMRQEYGHAPVNQNVSNPKFDQAAYRQAKRNQDLTPGERSVFIRQAWELSETPDQFVAHLNGMGYELSQGNRAGFVLLDRGSGEILKGSLGRHLKEPGGKAVKAAELRSWAEGLSIPLEKVQDTQARLKAETAQSFDRDAYHQAWQDRIDQAGIDHERGEEESEGSGDQRQFTKSPETIRQAFTDKSFEYDSFADELDAREAATQKKKPQKEDKNSFARELDEIKAKEEQHDIRRTQSNQDVKDYYRIEEIEAELAKEESILEKQNLVRKLTGGAARQQEKVEALRRTLENARMRQDEQVAKVDAQHKEEIEKINNTSAPANDLENNQAEMEEYKSYAETMDQTLDKERQAHSDRLSQEAALEAYYRLDQIKTQREELKSLEAELSTMSAGAQMQQKRARIEEIKKSIKDTVTRATEAKEAVDIKYEAAIEADKETTAQEYDQELMDYLNEKEQISQQRSQEQGPELRP